MTMPQTRHYEMKDSGVEWIGKMPIGWKIVPAKFFMKVQAGYPFDSERFDNSQGIPLIRIRDITSGHTETFYNGDYPEEYVVHNNDLLVGMDGDFNVRWWQGGEAVLNQRCCRIFARNGLLLRYFYFLLPFYLKQVNELAYSTTVKHLANGDIGNADICLPPEDEQTAIAAYLDEKCATIDAIIAEAKASIEEYKSWKASVIFETVTKGLNPNAEMKDSGVEWIGEMPGHWEIQKAKYYITVTNGSDPVTEGEIPVYGSGSKSFRTCGEYKEGPTVLVGRKGSIDKPRYVTGRYWNVDTAFDVKTKGFDLRLYYYLATCFDYQFYMSQTTLPSMTQTNYRNMFLPVPPLPEQTAIAAYLDSKCAAIGGIILEKEDLIRELENYRRSLIFEVVTGKRRVC